MHALWRVINYLGSDNIIISLPSGEFILERVGSVADPPLFPPPPSYSLACRHPLTHWQSFIAAL
jgi:hypothetical protein